MKPRDDEWSRPGQGHLPSLVYCTNWRPLGPTLVSLGARFKG